MNSLWMAKLALTWVGTKKVVKDFLKKNWKWVLPIVAAIGLYFYGSHLISNIKKTAYNEGVKAEQARWNKKIADEDKKNKEFETKLANVINSFGVKAVQEASARIKKESTYKEKITTIVENNPVYDQCVVDNSIIEARNKIRELGPQ